MTLDRIVEEYVTSMRENYQEKPSHRFSRRNPVLRALVEAHNASISPRSKLSRFVQDNQIVARDVIDSGRDIDPSRETGRYIGFLVGGYDQSEEESDFKEGLKEGTVLKMKSLGATHYKEGFIRGIVPMVLGNIMIASEQKTFESEELLNMVNTFRETIKLGMVASILYGAGSLIYANIMNNDENLSNELVTTGPYAIHRNPFYYGIIQTGVLGTAGAALMEFNSLETPNYLALGIMATGLAYATKKLNDYTKADEEILEVQFGEEYVKYKKRTNRFIPNPLNLFRK